LTNLRDVLVIITIININFEVPMQLKGSKTEKILVTATCWRITG
jgi:hypothetical protein